MRKGIRQKEAEFFCLGGFQKMLRSRRVGAAGYPSARTSRGDPAGKRGLHGLQGQVVANAFKTISFRTRSKSLFAEPQIVTLSMYPIAFQIRIILRVSRDNHTFFYHDECWRWEIME